MIGGAVGFLVVILARKEGLPHPTGEAWLAWAYLVIFGSVIAFTSYMATLRLLPIQVVMTYAYVNPVIAVFLGWLILSEEVTGYTLFGAVLVLLNLPLVVLQWRLLGGILVIVEADGRTWLRHPDAGDVELDTERYPWSDLVPVEADFADRNRPGMGKKIAQFCSNFRSKPVC